MHCEWGLHPVDNIYKISQCTMNHLYAQKVLCQNVTAILVTLGCGSGFNNMVYCMYLLHGQQLTCCLIQLIYCTDYSTSIKQDIVFGI